MANDSENLAGATVQMAAVDFEQPTNGNNDPAKTLDREKLELDTDSIDRLSVKPVQKYRFIRSIGRGGMKMVLQMKDQDATRDVAMAVLPEATTRPKDDLVRFIQEARITASLEHPNIVPVHEIGVDSTGAPYYTMKLLRGRTLAALISSLAAGDERAISEYKTIRLLRIFLKICNGVAFAHSKGVIHLDLKPDNIQVGDFGEVLILDWGLAKVRNHEEQKESGFEVDLPGGFGGGTLDGVMKGTPGYMAPEQAAGRNSQRDERTDVYALGAILYTMMTWKDPLEQKSVHERIDATLAGNIIPPGERAPEREIPAGVEAVIRKAMTVQLPGRYQSVKELRDEVRAFRNGFATQAEKAGFLKRFLLMIR
ncbi:MAG: serine/threonine protein kinase, partial [Lentisphaeria bacterium]|nr:serine/threonine protein kinase [Lentisphaeria bacterium]